MNQLIDQVLDPTTGHTPRIADLNERNDPRKLSHYYKIAEYDAEVLGGSRAIALCGYDSAKITADIDGYDRARSHDNLLCPHCAVLYSILPTRND